MVQNGRLKSWVLWSNGQITELERGGLVSNWLRDPGPATECLWAWGSSCLKEEAGPYHLQGPLPPLWVPNEKMVALVLLMTRA